MCCPFGRKASPAGSANSSHGPKKIDLPAGRQLAFRIENTLVQLPRTSRPALFSPPACSSKLVCNGHVSIFCEGEDKILRRLIEWQHCRQERGRNGGEDCSGL